MTAKRDYLILVAFVVGMLLTVLTLAIVTGTAVGPLGYNNTGFPGSGAPPW